VNVGLLTAEILGVGEFGAPQQISTGFLGSATARHSGSIWASVKLWGVEQKAPHIFGRAAAAAITLGIGPHSSLFICLCPFSGTHLQVRSVDEFSRMTAQTTRTRARMCLSWLSLIWLPI